MKRKSVFFACALFALAFSANGAMASGRHDAGTAKGQGSSGNATASKKAKAVQDGFVFVEGGTFQMGDNDNKYASPKHLVEVSNFYICDHEVTQKEYLDVIGENPSNKFAKGDDKPVDCVSWYDAVEYCNALSVKKDLTPCYTIDKSKADWGDNPCGVVTCNFSANGYRLPTEAEWEYAARGGKKSKGYKYSGSDNIDCVAWYHDNCYSVEDNELSGAHIVMTKSKNEIDLYDMSGNVWEWCWDKYAEYTPSLKSNPTGASSGYYRVCRGDGSYQPAKYCLVVHRSRLPSDNTKKQFGFRVVRSAQ